MHEPIHPGQRLRFAKVNEIPLSGSAQEVSKSNDSQLRVGHQCLATPGILRIALVVWVK